MNKFFIDIKSSPEAHKKLTGMSQSLIIENIKKMMKKGLSSKIELRMPVIPTYNDTEDVVKGIAQTLKAVNKPEISLLRYNYFWEAKLERIQTNQQALKIKKDREASIEQVKNLLEGQGISVKLPQSSSLLKSTNYKTVYIFNQQNSSFSPSV